MDKGVRKGGNTLGKNVGCSNSQCYNQNSRTEHVERYILTLLCMVLSDSFSVFSPVCVLRFPLTVRGTGTFSGVYNHSPTRENYETRRLLIKIDPITRQY